MRGSIEAHRLHRPEAQRFRAALGHHFDRQAAFEIGRVLFPFLELGLRRRIQRGDEGFVLRLIHRAIDVGGLVAAGAFLVVARLLPGDVEVDRVRMHDRRDRVEEGERVFAGALRMEFASDAEVSGPVAKITRASGVSQQSIERTHFFA